MRRRQLVILAAVFLGALLVGCDGGDDDGDLGDACLSNADCESDLFCEKPVGECDAAGTCDVMPGPCPAIEAPVCGCDGFTYSSDCVAWASGVSVQSESPCP